MISSFNILTAPEEDMSIWAVIWNYFDSKYFSIDLGSYENLGFGENPMISVAGILFAFVIGMIIAAVSATFNKRVLGELVRQMVYQGAVGKENAKTLEELGFSGNRAVAQSLRRGVTLRKVVKCAEETDYNAELEAQRAQYEERRKGEEKLPPFKYVEYEVNTRTDRFYIREEDKYTAQIKFEKKGSTWFGVILVSIASIIGMFLILRVLPSLLGFLDAALGSMNQPS